MVRGESSPWGTSKADLVPGLGPLCCVLEPGSWVMGPACVLGIGLGLGPGPGPEVGPPAGLGPKFLGAGFWGHGPVMAQAPALASDLVGCVSVCAGS